ncbi:MAG: ATP-binding cassette domain-containing protein [Candidatus Brocadiia bacterium]
MAESKDVPAAAHELAAARPAEGRTAPPAVEVKDLYFSYKNHRALSGVSFSVEPRSIHGFVGPNGAGKTTMLKILATLLRPKSGEARLFGLDAVRDYKAVRAKLSFMPDHFSMYRQMTIFEYLDFFAAAYGQPLAERDRVIHDVLKLTDMEGRQNDLIRTLSRGMQQRVSLARVLVHDPELLLLDEPASGLDPRARIELMEILKELRRMGKTIFISSHILSELATLCDSFTIIDRGVVKYTGSKHALLVQDGRIHSYVIALARAHPPVEEMLRKLDGVTGVSPMDEEAAYRVTFDAEKLGVNAVLSAIIASGAELASLQEDTGQLNRAFMDLTEPGVPT